jgi:hypothetical protein
LRRTNCGRVVVSHTASDDGRVEIRYLVRDQKGEHWELAYMIRRVDIDRWRPLLAEVDGPELGPAAP